jgi:stearoyl-CoA desaturase (delta-9 desaturase)
VPYPLLAIIVGLATCQVALLVTSIFLHRGLAHRALALAPPATLACRLLLWVTTGIRPRQWVAVHRKHHAYTDVAGDPHSPLLEGFATVQFANVALYRRAARDPGVVARYARDLPPDRLDRVLLDHALPGLAVGFGVLVATLGWQMALVAAAVHMVAYLLASAAVNAIGHSFGGRPFANLATNNQWLAWVAAGEGLHNNHHAAPTSARFALIPGQVDPGWWLVRALAGSGLATVRHSQPKLKDAPRAA